MKKNITKSIIACLLIAAGSLTAQDAAQGQQKIIRVCSLNSVQANQEFQRNVQLLQAQRQRVVELKRQLDASNDAGQKMTVQKDLDEMLKKLNENNQVMFKTYGFSLTRNYSMVVEKSHVYMLVSEDEAMKFEESQAAGGQ